MIGLSLVAEGFGFHIPKGYLYAAIGFSIIIEVFNQIARRNFIRHQSTLPLRARTADAILRLMGGNVRPMFSTMPITRCRCRSRSRKVHLPKKNVT